MPDELDDFIGALTTVIVAVTGINVAPTSPPEKINEPPMALCYLVSGSPSNPTAQTWVHVFHCDVFLARAMLAHAEAQARPFILRGIKAINANYQMSSTCEKCDLTGYQYGTLKYGGEEFFGVRFMMDVKIQHTTTDISVSV